VAAIGLGVHGGGQDALHGSSSTFGDGDPLPVYRRFRDQGRLASDCLRYVASWVTDDSRCCFQIIDRALLTQWTARWDDLIEFEVILVVTSPEAAATVSSQL